MKSKLAETAMAMRMVLWAALVSTLWNGQALVHGATGPMRSSEKVSVDYRFSLDRAPAGESFDVAVVLDIEEGWHVQAATPTYDHLIPTRLRFDPAPGIEVGEILYPPPRKLAVDFEEEALAVYGGVVPLVFTVKVSADAEPGLRELRGELVVQACDDQVCLAPETIAVTIPLDVVAAGTPVADTHTEWFEAMDQAALVSVSPDSEIERLLGERGTVLAFLAIFVIGLALNLTPCVYPMLSVTVAIFGDQTDARLARVFLKAAVYVLGIATMYSTLGTVAALTGELFGAVLQSPWVLGGIAVLLAALALSMFGLYEIRPPSAWMDRLGGAHAAGWMGLFVSGLVVGVFAAPCIGPPIVALLTLVGAKGDPWFGFGAFFVLSLGLGAPYLVLGTFSGLLKRLPKSGAWMIWIKKVFGVVLLGVALFFAALAFTPGLLWWVPVLALAVGGLYLGFLERSGNERTVFRRLKRVLGVAAIAGGVVLFIDGQQRTPMEWDPYHPARLEEGKPVVLDFYADWCIPCHELKRRTFSNPDVQDALRDHIKLKVDVTRITAPESVEVMRRFNVQGVPTVIFLDEQGEERPDTRVLGFMPPEAFLERARL